MCWNVLEPLPYLLVLGASEETSVSFESAVSGEELVAASRDAANGNWLKQPVVPNARNELREGAFVQLSTWLMGVRLEQL